MTILTIENMDFGCGHGQNFGHLTMVILKFRPWSWSKTIRPLHSDVGQMVKKSWSPYPPPHLIYITVGLYIIGHNYHGHYLHAGGLSVNNYVRENKVREVNVRE